MSDLRLAIRTIRATIVVSIVAALSLALGIGANTAIFSLVNSLIVRALTVREPYRLSRIDPAEVLQYLDVLHIAGASYVE